LDAHLQARSSDYALRNLVRSCRKLTGSSQEALFRVQRDANLTLSAEREGAPCVGCNQLHRRSCRFRHQRCSTSLILHSTLLSGAPV